MLRIVILTAVRLEAKAVARALGLPPVGKDQWQFGDVGLFLMGISASRLSTIPIPRQAVITAGVAGGLDPNLNIGDVILDDQSNPAVAQASVAQASVARASRPWSVAKIHSVSSIITTPAQKAALFAQTAAAAVDMENRAVRAWAAAHRLSYCGVRAISDTASHTLDPAVLSLVDDLGTLKPAALAKLLLTRPAMINQLRQLGAHTKTAAHAAAQAVKTILATGWPV